MDFEFLKQCASEVGVELTLEQTERLAAYFDMVVEKNKAFNLTAITEEKDFAIKHIADSLAGISEIPPKLRSFGHRRRGRLSVYAHCNHKRRRKSHRARFHRKKDELHKRVRKGVEIDQRQDRCRQSGRAKEFVCNFRRGDGKGGVFAQHTSRACNAHAQNGRKIYRIQDGRERA